MHFLHGWPWPYSDLCLNSQLSEKLSDRVMYLNMCLSLMTSFGVFEEPLVGRPFLSEIPQWWWDLSVYILNPFPVLCFYCGGVQTNQPASSFCCHSVTTVWCHHITLDTVGAIASQWYAILLSLLFYFFKETIFSHFICQSQFPLSPFLLVPLPSPPHPSIHSSERVKHIVLRPSPL